MNRTGFAIALLVGVGVGVVFGFWPQLDIAISRLFFDEARGTFPALYSLVSRHLRDLFTYIVAALAAPAFIAVIVKLPAAAPPHADFCARRPVSDRHAGACAWPDDQCDPQGQLASAAAGEVTQLGGPEQFMPWWDPRGACDKNCSFVAGEGSGAFWTLAPAALVAPAWLPVAYGAALLLGAAAGLQRIPAARIFFRMSCFPVCSRFWSSGPCMG